MLVRVVTPKMMGGFFSAGWGNGHEGVGIEILEVSFLKVRHKPVYLLSFVFEIVDRSGSIRACRAEWHIERLVLGDRIASSALESMLWSVGRYWDLRQVLPRLV